MRCDSSRRNSAAAAGVVDIAAGVGIAAFSSHLKIVEKKSTPVAGIWNPSLERS